MRSTSFAATAVLLGVLLTAGCGGGSTKTTPSTPPPSPAAPTAAAGLTARQVADRLADVIPLPNPRDNTRSCKAAGCVQLITTDSVSVYQWPDEKKAKTWAAGFPKADTRQVGVFVLSFAGGDAAATSTEARDQLATGLRNLIGH